MLTIFYVFKFNICSYYCIYTLRFCVLYANWHLFTSKLLPHKRRSASFWYLFRVLSFPVHFSIVGSFKIFVSDLNSNISLPSLPFDDFGMIISKVKSKYIYIF